MKILNHIKIFLIGLIITIIIITIALGIEKLISFIHKILPNITIDDILAPILIILVIYCLGYEVKRMFRDEV